MTDQHGNAGLTEKILLLCFIRTLIAFIVNLKTAIWGNKTAAVEKESWLA